MIVRTLLDTDLYKFTTSYAYIKLFPYAMGTFSFNDRNETEYTEEFLEALKSEFSNLSRLRLTEEELEYMTRNCRFLPRVYWEWLSSFRFDPGQDRYSSGHNGPAAYLKSAIFFIKSTLYEVPLLANRIRNQKQVFRQHTRYERDTLQIVGESGIVQSAPAPLLGVRHAEKILNRRAGDGDQTAE